MFEWAKEHPETVYLVSAALVGWVIRSLRKLVKDEAEGIKASVLAVVEQNRKSDKHIMDVALTQIRQQIADFGQRFDMHLERCQITPPPENKKTLHG